MKSEKSKSEKFSLFDFLNFYVFGLFTFYFFLGSHFISPTYLEVGRAKKSVHTYLVIYKCLKSSRSY